MGADARADGSSHHDITCDDDAHGARIWRWCRRNGWHGGRGCGRHWLRIARVPYAAARQQSRARDAESRAQQIAPGEHEVARRCVVRVVRMFAHAPSILHRSLATSHCGYYSQRAAEITIPPQCLGRRLPRSQAHSQPQRRAAKTLYCWRGRYRWEAALPGESPVSR